MKKLENEIPGILYYVLTDRSSTLTHQNNLFKN